MKPHIRIDKEGTLWKGFSFWRENLWFDLGLIAVDVYRGTPVPFAIYFWKFTFEIHR